MELTGQQESRQRDLTSKPAPRDTVVQRASCLGPSLDGCPPDSDTS